MDPSESRPLTRGQIFGYGLGALGTGVYSTVPGLLLVYYMTDTLAIAAGLAGLAAVIPRVWDVVTDPLMGMISDRTRSTMGRRRPYLLLGGILLPLAFAALFATPSLSSPAAMFAYVLAMYVACATAFTIYAVPYTAMPAEMTRDYHGGTSLMSARMALMTVGILLGGTAPMLVKAAGGGAGGYRLMGLCIGGVMMLGLLGAFIGTRNAPQARAQQDPPKWREQLAIARRNKPFATLLVAYVTQLVSVGCILTSVPFFAKYVVVASGFASEDLVTILFLCLVVPTVLTMAPWTAFSKRVGKRSALLCSQATFALGACGLWWTAQLSIWAVAINTAVIGVGFAGTQLFPYAMLPDTILLDQVRSGMRREGVYSGVWTAGDKGGQALGVGVASGLLALTGFIESGAGQLIDQPQLARTGIALASSFVPACMMLLSALLLRRYRLGREQVANLESQLGQPAG